MVVYKYKITWETIACDSIEGYIEALNYKDALNKIALLAKLEEMEDELIKDKHIKEINIRKTHWESLK